ncbi:MAG: hypothetical protein IKR81_18365, partial [Victivallales bacterium]|nr:hypothetical protein [Victivallales bacterium]
MKRLLLVLLCGFVLRGVCGNLLSSSEFEVSSVENNVVLGEFVEVSEGRSYRLSGNVLGNAKVVVGLMFYDAAKHQILPHQVNAVPGTETVLVETSEKNA